MPTPKYKSYFNEMFKAHQEKMMKFMILNQDYKQNRVNHHAAFNNQGKEIQQIVEDWLNKLCNNMEKGKYSTYSAKLAEKFLQEVTKYFPCYHEIGIKITK